MGGNSFISIIFEQDGDVGYLPAIGSPYVYFGDYRNEWSKLEIEWRSFDKKARYRINTGAWTSWDNFPNSGYFIDFDRIGFELSKNSGPGVMKIDNLQ